MEFLTDATFLVELWRERRRTGPAMRFLKAHPTDAFSVPWVAKGEFLRGAVVVGADEERVRSFLAGFRTAFPTETTLDVYAKLYALLRSRNQLVGPHDLWIAAAGLDLRLPLLSRNTDEFERVPDLTVIDYGNPT